MEIRYLSAMNSIALDYGYFTLVSKVKRGNILERVIGSGEFIGYITIEGVILQGSDIEELLGLIGEQYDIKVLNKLPIAYTKFISDKYNKKHEVLRDSVVSFIVNNHIHQVLADERGKPVEFRGKKKGIVFEVVYNKAIIDGEVSNTRTYVEELRGCIELSEGFKEEVLDPGLQVMRRVYIDKHKNPFEYTDR